MKPVTISHFKAHCVALLDEVSRTGETLVVLKRGKPLARIVPTSRASEEVPQSTLRGTVTYLGDLVEPAVPRSAWNA